MKIKAQENKRDERGQLNQRISAPPELSFFHVGLILTRMLLGLRMSGSARRYIIELRTRQEGLSPARK